ncbi:sugar ABC transporter ATP-binding protein [Gemmobacter fulvus]|uniref:sugar ABC transporter ATP-binding protein n=1 Tax=Gemmobacter fulvus TaxID=2840474 RepID=UPI00279640EE|nr:sugar ABC transporter ATP-binding protein [Gemmobacter fulvus]MDQ1850611.1 sugar ABC transporter ATP-binding protein [Gemmobacter fulvus]
MSAATAEVGSGTIVSLSGASKFYGSFAALKNVSLSLRRGEVHMLLGENGAGKSTLVSLLTGVNKLDEGERSLRGTALPDLSPAQARAAGVNAVLQDFSLAPAMTVAENYGLGREPRRAGLLDHGAIRKAAQVALDRLDLRFSPDTRVETLSRAEQQLLEIARAIDGVPGVLILDEPTAALSHDESERLFEIVLKLRAEGWAILYISHRMEEIRRLGDVVTILRDGRQTGHYRLADVTNEQMIADMVGREMDHFYPDIPHAPGKPMLEVEDLVAGPVRKATLRVCAGEIVGLGGLVGCGKAEVARAIFGLLPMTGGRITVAGQDVASRSPAGLLARGLVYLPQDRRGEALALGRSVAENMQIEVLADPRFTKAGLVRSGRLAQLVDRLMTRLNVTPALPDLPVASLSGGNQQKVVLGRALSRQRKVYIFDEPTAGVDVGARLEFYLQLERLVAEGAAVLLITSDLQELVHLAHRAYVMHEGHVVADLPKAALNEQTVVAHAFGDKSLQGTPQ